MQCLPYRSHKLPILRQALFWKTRTGEQLLQAGHCSPLQSLVSHSNLVQQSFMKCFAVTAASQSLHASILQLYLQAPRLHMRCATVMTKTGTNMQSNSLRPSLTPKSSIAAWHACSQCHRVLERLCEHSTHVVTRSAVQRQSLCQQMSSIAGTNLWDAQQTVDSIVEDFPQDKMTSLPELSESLQSHLDRQATVVVNYAGFGKIDQYEVQSGQSVGKPREKMVDLQRMLQIAR